MGDSEWTYWHLSCHGQWWWWKIALGWLSASSIAGTQKCSTNTHTHTHTHTHIHTHTHTHTQWAVCHTFSVIVRVFWPADITTSMVPFCWWVLSPTSFVVSLGCKCNGTWCFLLSVILRVWSVSFWSLCNSRVSFCAAELFSQVSFCLYFELIKFSWSSLHYMPSETATAVKEILLHALKGTHTENLRRAASARNRSAGLNMLCRVAPSAKSVTGRPLTCFPTAWCTFGFVSSRKLGGRRGRKATKIGKTKVDNLSDISGKPEALSVSSGGGVDGRRGNES